MLLQNFTVKNVKWRFEVCPFLTGATERNWLLCIVIHIGEELMNGGIAISLSKYFTIRDGANLWRAHV